MPEKNSRSATITSLIVLVIVMYLIYSVGVRAFGGPQPDTLATNEFVTAVKQGRVDDVTYKVDDGSLSGSYWREDAEKGNEDQLTEFRSVYVGSDSLAELMANNPSVTYTIDTSDSDLLETVLVSVWEADGFTVSFVTGAGSAVDDVVLPYGARLDVNEYVTVREGYSFLGWYESASASDPYDASTMPDRDVTLYAKWTRINYTITYNLDGGTNNSANPATYTVESPDIVLASPTKNGYEFQGWYSDSGFETPVEKSCMSHIFGREICM